VPSATKRGEPEASRASWPAGARRRGSPIPSWSSGPSGGGSPPSTRLRILGEADACSRPGEIGALLRRTERLGAELAKARKVIEIQGNVSALLEQMLSTEGANEPGSSER
jgi:hypothetical protein